MATTPTTHATTGRTGWILATTGLLVVAAVLLIVALAASTDTTTARGETATPAIANDPDRGAGDPCALRHETRGGFLEGLDPANRCATPNGQPRTGGRIP